MNELRSGMLGKIKQKLHMATPLTISLLNESEHGIEYEVEENCDGARPSLLIRIKRVRSLRG